MASDNCIVWAFKHLSSIESGLSHMAPHVIIHTNALPIIEDCTVMLSSYIKTTILRSHVVPSHVVSSGVCVRVHSEVYVQVPRAVARRVVQLRRRGLQSKFWFWES